MLSPIPLRPGSLSSPPPNHEQIANSKCPSPSTPSPFTTQGPSHIMPSKKSTKKDGKLHFTHKKERYSNKERGSCSPFTISHQLFHTTTCLSSFSKLETSTHNKELERSFTHKQAGYKTKAFKTSLSWMPLLSKSNYPNRLHISAQTTPSPNPSLPHLPFLFSAQLHQLMSLNPPLFHRAFPFHFLTSIFPLKAVGVSCLLAQATTNFLFRILSLFPAIVVIDCYG